ncbi:hypothetical protein ACWF94_32125 [Streptomyces sp. NPDC055078]
MSGLTLSGLDSPLRVLRLLVADFSGLPAPSVAVSDITPNRLELSFYDDFAAFETWRAALNFDPGAVSYGEQRGGRTRVLSVTAEYAGASVRLVGYTTHPDHIDHLDHLDHLDHSGGAA